MTRVVPIFALAPDVQRVLDRPAAEVIYDAHLAFVWRNLKRLGVAVTQLEDATQDVFVVVHRRIREFEGRSAVRTWLFSIVLRVAHDYRRSESRRRRWLSSEAVSELPARCSKPDPYAVLVGREAATLLDRILAKLSDDRRAVFVLVELEQMCVPDAAEAMGWNVNTAYARLRAARRQFEAELLRLRARERAGSVR
jgi:RNA polymerase sigma-70 factor (ECF subfamily)